LFEPKNVDRCVWPKELGSADCSLNSTRLSLSTRLEYPDKVSSGDFRIEIRPCYRPVLDQVTTKNFAASTRSWKVAQSQAVLRLKLNEVVCFHFKHITDWERREKIVFQLATSTEIVFENKALDRWQKVCPF